MPFSRGVIWLNKLQPWDAETGKTILVGGVLLKPPHPEYMDLLSLGSAGDWLCAFVVDGNSEYVDKSAVSIGVGVVVFRSDDHDVRSRAEVDNI